MKSDENEFSDIAKVGCKPRVLAKPRQELLSPRVGSSFFLVCNWMASSMLICQDIKLTSWRLQLRTHGKSILDQITGFRVMLLVIKGADMASRKGVFNLNQ
jgi:hypothetical protein